MDICALPHLVWQPKVRVSSTLTVGRDSMTMPGDLVCGGGRPTWTRTA